MPVGKSYFGFTDEELKELDRWVRNHTVDSFGPALRSSPSSCSRSPSIGAPLLAPQIRVAMRFAHQPHPLGQARRRGRPACRRFKP